MTTETIITGVRVLPGLDQQPEFVQLRADCLDDIRDYLGCDWVTAVQISVPGVSMWLDEEATLRHGAVLNEHASGILYPGRVYGVALLTRALPGGGMAGLTSQQLDALTERGISPRRRPQLRADLQWMSEEETAELIGYVQTRIINRRRGGDGMSLLETLARLNDRLDAVIDRHVHRHPTIWIVATSLLIVAAVIALRGALL